MVLLAAFALLAFVLAAVGAYGVISYLVAQGAREIAIRMALGATPGGVLGFGMRQSLVVAVVGVAVGLAGATIVARLMRSLLFGVRAGDPVTFAVVGLLMLAVAALASAVPALRATHVNPTTALNTE